MKALNILVNSFKKNNYLIILKKFLSRFEKDQTNWAHDWTKIQVVLPLTNGCRGLIINYI